MKFKVKKSSILTLIRKGKEVATKSPKAGLELGDRLSIAATDNKLSFASTNGHVDFNCDLVADTENALEIESNGDIIIESIVLNKAVSAIGGSSNIDTIIGFELDDQSLSMKAEGKRKKKATIQTLKLCRATNIKKPKKSILTHTFNVEDFSRAVRDVSPYATTRGYKVRYQMICCHFLPNEIRFVCGNGNRFAVLCVPQDKPVNVDSAGLKILLPADQARIIDSVVSDASTVTLTFKNERECYIETDTGIEMCLRGIPDEKYIAYENHAFRHAEAKSIVDLKISDFLEGTELVGAMRDVELEKEGSFLSASFNATDNCLRLKVDEDVGHKRYRCTYECDAQYYKVDKDADDSFDAMYAYTIMNDVARSSKRAYVRFYCINAKGTSLADLVELTDAKDDNGIPIVKDDGANKSKLSFFFAAVKEEKA